MNSNNLVEDMNMSGFSVDGFAAACKAAIPSGADIGEMIVHASLELTML